MNESPVQKRDWYVARQIAAQRATSTAAPDVEAITKSTTAALSEMDRAIATGEIKIEKSAKERTPSEVTRDKEQLQAKTQAEEIGAEFFTRDLPAVDPPKPVKRRTGVELERYMALCRRIKMLCTRSTSRRLRYGRDSIEQADFEFPQFAMEIVEETMKCAMGRGIYLHLSKADRGRVRDAALERIADRSNAVVGYGWWVKR